MPFYRCVIPKNALSFEQRQEVAGAFTDIHCGISAAPRNFVNVVFLEASNGMELADSHGNGQVRYDTPFFLAGGNRAGRPPEVRQRILEGLIDSLSTIAGVPKDQVSGHISESPASWIMEAGQILPEPGEETAEWYEHSAASG